MYVLADRIIDIEKRWPRKALWTTTWQIVALWGFVCLQMGYSQSQTSVSGNVVDGQDTSPLAYVNVVLKTSKDSAFVTGTVTDEEGRFVLTNVAKGDYQVEVSYIGYTTVRQNIYIGNMSNFLDINTIILTEEGQTISEITVVAKQDEVGGKLDKKVFSVSDNISQGGGSVLQTMQNLPGVTIQDGKVQLRGNDKVTVLLDGKQTALTGFGSQSGLDNIPASAIEKIEIINNPSSKYDANGNAGIINIVYKKNKSDGFTGKIGLSVGLGAWTIKKENLPTIRPQYQHTPKINPSISLNYRKKKLNLFAQIDNLYTQTLNKNEFTTRTYDDGTIIQQQLKRNRNTNFLNTKAGLDYTIDDNNSLTFSGAFGSEKIIDRGDEPFFNETFTVRNRLWQFLEDEIKTTVMATVAYKHLFPQPGHTLNIGCNYTFHREDEKYFFDNINPTFTGYDSFKLLSDEQVIDLNIDYVKPLRYGHIEAGIKIRNRSIPTNMQFFQGINSPLDANAGGWANYKEIIPAAYGNYIFENKKIEAEIGLRIEYVDLTYDVNPDHNTYKSDGYTYTQPFPTVRLAYKLTEQEKITLFYNRRVDRPNEVDIRIFPKYDDAEIIKVGNPGLRPQFTNSLELGYKSSWDNGYFYSALYHKMADATITRISTITPNSTLIYAVFQNAGKSYTSGIEMVITQDISPYYSMNLNVNGYRNQINAFSIINQYPVTSTYSSEEQLMYSGNIKLNNTFHITKQINAQITAIYLAPDIIPQGKIAARFTLDVGIKKQVQKGKGEVFLNATDLLNTMVITKNIDGNGFSYVSSDYYETQVIRLGYSYKL